MGSVLGVLRLTVSSFGLIGRNPMHKRLLSEATFYTGAIVILFALGGIETTKEFWHFTGWYVAITLLLMALSKKVTTNEQN